MVCSKHEIRFPNESDAYRATRNVLLEAEADLREQIENVAAMRRKLPLGGAIPEDYVFEDLVLRAGQAQLREYLAPTSVGLTARKRRSS